MFAPDFGFITNKSQFRQVVLIAMSDNNEIPCSTCHKWKAAEKTFSCNPSKCEKLSEWLFDHSTPEAETEKAEAVQIFAAPLQYVV
jgi:hypothetical protein